MTRDQALYCSSLTFSIQSTALPVELFLNGDVGHGGGWRSAMPMLLARRKPDHVARTDFFNRSSPALRPAATGGDDEGLTQRVGVPGGASAGLEGDGGGRGACRRVRLERGRCARCR